MNIFVKFFITQKQKTVKICAVWFPLKSLQVRAFPYIQIVYSIAGKYIVRGGWKRFPILCSNRDKLESFRKQMIGKYFYCYDCSEQIVLRAVDWTEEFLISDWATLSTRYHWLGYHKRNLYCFSFLLPYDLLLFVFSSGCGGIVIE